MVEDNPETQRSSATWEDPAEHTVRRRTRRRRATIRHTQGMLRFTDLIRSEVHGPTGRNWGRLVDIAVRFNQPGAATVTGLRIVDRGLVTWSRAEGIDPASLVTGTIVLKAEPLAGAVDDRDYLAADELLLRRDVLDTQIVDVKGRRVSRVGDVILAVTDDAIEAVAVEVGLGSIVRRLGWRRLAERVKEQAVPWADLHLTSDRGHLVQCHSEAALVHRLDGKELAELVARVPSAHAVELLEAVPTERADQALEISHPHVRSRLARVRSTNRPAPPRWHRLRGWDSHRGPLRHTGRPDPPDSR